MTGSLSRPLSAMALGFVLPHLSAIHKRPEFRPAVAMGGSINGVEKCKMLGAWIIGVAGSANQFSEFKVGKSCCRSLWGSNTLFFHVFAQCNFPVMAKPY